MLENKFINHRTLLQRVIDYFVDAIHTHFGYPNINVKMQSFKMADDVAQKQLLINLASEGKISNKTLINEILPEVDLEEEMEQIKHEQLQNLAIQGEIQRASMSSGVVMGGGGQQSGQGGPESPQGLPEQNPPRSEGANQQI
jgi:hypothetical protein